MKVADRYRRKAVNLRAVWVLAVTALTLMCLGCASRKECKPTGKKADALVADELKLQVDTETIGNSREMRAMESRKGSSVMAKEKADMVTDGKPTFDWGPRYVELVVFCSERFTEPEEGKMLNITLQNGTEVTGNLIKKTDSWVKLAVESGGTVKFTKEQLSTDSRCLLYKNDYVSHFATKRLEEEQSIFEATGRLPKGH